MNERCKHEMDRMEKKLLKQKNIENDKLSAMVASHQHGESLLPPETSTSGDEDASPKTDQHETAQEPARKRVRWFAKVGVFH